MQISGFRDGLEVASRKDAKAQSGKAALVTSRLGVTLIAKFLLRWL